MIVCKFGGSSLADAARMERVARIVRADRARRFVVVSAPGKRFEGDEKVTDLLLRASLGDAAALEAAMGRFRTMAVALGVDVERELRRAEADIPALGADHAASRGEYLCAQLMARLLRCAFVDAAQCVFFRADGSVDMERTYAQTLRLLRPLERAVLPGFYGSMPDGSVRTFPRGGSDVTGALVAGATGALAYENWTDVDGLMSADPRLVEGAVRVPELSYRQMRLLGSMGAQVLHPDSLRPVARAGIPTVLKNSFHPEAAGTRIGPDARTRVPCVTGRALRGGDAVVAVLSPEAMALASGAAAALEAVGVRAHRLCAWSDHLLLRVRGGDLSASIRALHRALVEGRA